MRLYPVVKKVRHRQPLLFNMTCDGGIAAIMTLVARWLAVPHEGVFHPLWFVAGGTVTLVVSGFLFKLPQQYWRYSSVRDVHRVVWAALSSAIFFALMLIVTGFSLPTRTFPIIHFLCLLVGLCGVRYGERLFLYRNRSCAVEQKVLLIGTPNTLDISLRILQARVNSYRVVGLVSIGKAPVGQRIHEAPILGGLDDIQAIIKMLSAREEEIDYILVAGNAVRGSELMDLLSCLEPYSLSVRRLVIHEFSSLAVGETQPLELDDLLNRDPVSLSEEVALEVHSFIQGRRIVVTGAGGSIGSELIRQIASFRPESVCLIDNSEYALWQISLDIQDMFPHLVYETFLADIRNDQRIRVIFQEYRPDVVFHAAALKHVPLVEKNIHEGLLTNTIGTRVVADCARHSDVKTFVMISTDKAVYPSSMMGASKRCAEVYAQALDKQACVDDNGMRCVSVRFGNVLGSTGSVVPLFQRQIAHGGPVTITDPEMTRYFMTIPEAVGLVLQAAVRGTSHQVVNDELEDRLHSGSIFVLDMGNPVRIMDLARHMIRLSGKEPERDIAIKITGRREGEKLSETLFYHDENPLKTDRERLWIVTPEVLSLSDVMSLFSDLEKACRAEDTSQALAILHHLVPDYMYEGVAERPL